MRGFEKIIPIAFILLIAILNACDNNKGGQTVEGSLVVSDQVISQNSVYIEIAFINATSGWVVVHKDKEGPPESSEIITQPVLLDLGKNNNLTLNISPDANISDGEKVWIMIHKDTGEKNKFEYGKGTLDPPLKNSGSYVARKITINSPYISANNQSLTAHEITIEEISSATQGWIVIHEEKGSGVPGDALGYTQVQEGVTENLKVLLTDTVSYASGNTLYAMLHVDKGKRGEYEFPGPDVPEVFGNEESNLIVKSFTIESVTNEVIIDMKNNRFDPSSKTIAVGTKVKWLNKDSYTHTITSDDGKFSSGNIAADMSFSHTFEQKGTFNYSCSIHQDMTGKIIVK